MYERSLLRYAHTTGFTYLSYTNDGEFILTCGSDGDIRKWRNIDDDDPSSNCLGEYVVCLAHKGDKLLASTDRNTVQSYTFPDMDLDGTLMRFTAPVVAIKVRNDCVIAGSEDTKIKIISDDIEPIELDGHNGPVLALDIHPVLPYLASAGGDGVLKIWNTSEGKEIKAITGLPKTNSFENAKYFITPTFEPHNGNFLAYGNGKEINILSNSTWGRLYSLRDDKITGQYTCCKFSKDGSLIAAGTDLGEISVFDVITREAKLCEAPSSDCQSITCLDFSGKNNSEIAYCDASGQLGILFLVDRSDEQNEGKNDIECTEDSQSIDQVQLSNADSADDEDDENVSIEKLKSKIMYFTKTDDIQCDENSRDSTVKARSESSSVFGLNNKAFKQQKAFQPSSTPTQLEHCYLVWNSVGIVTLHADGSDGAIDVEFHDASVHHSLHIPNYNSHNIASLSTTVLAMASTNSSKVVCIALSASGNKEWSILLPDCESVEALCATSKIVAVISNLQFLRIFTVMGTQREIISIPGPIVCISGFEDRILVCYHCAPSSVNQQNIQGILLQMTGLKIKCQNINIPLKPERYLSWVGFSDYGSPIIYDSMGLVQLFGLKSNCWYPVCDTMKQSSSVSNNYFIISLSERSQILQAVLCRGTSYPMTTPRPMIQELPLRIPLCDIESEKTVFEDSLLRSNIMAMDDAEKIFKETAIKLFALSCRNEIEARAKELIETIACTDLLALAVKYATNLGRFHLSDNLAEMLPQIEEAQQIKEYEEQLIQQSLPISLSSLKSYQNVLSSDTKKIAPKLMELCAAKKNSLKKLSYTNNSPSTSLLKKLANEQIFSTTTTESSQENCDISGLNSEAPNKLFNSGDLTMMRTSLNSVNPFASKRKYSDVDKTILMGSEKLKIVKK